MYSIKRATAFLSSFLLVLAFVGQAWATILFAGGEDTDFTIVGNCSVSTTGGSFRATYAREAILCNQGGSASDPALSRFYTAAFTATQTLWLHTEYFSAALGTDNNSQVMCAITNDGVCRLLIRGTGSAGTVKMSTRTSGGAFVDIVTCTVGAFPVPSSLLKLDWQITYAVAGSANFYVNGVNSCSYTGDVTAGSGQTMIKQYYFSGAATGANYSWSEVVVATTDTRDFNLWTCAPGANGTTQNWTGSASDVNETTINDSTAITTGSTNVIGNFTCALSLPAGKYTIPAVVQSARVQGLPGTIAHFRFNARPAGSGADFDTTSDIATTGTFTSYPNNIVPIDPSTSGAWTTNTVGAGINFGVKSRP